MKKNTYLLSGVCVVLFMAYGLYYFVKDEPAVPPKPKEAAAEQPAVTSFAGSSIIEERDGKKLWELSAEKIDFDVNTKQVRLYNLKGRFYRQEGGTVDITAPLAAMNQTTKDLTLNGGVTAVASDGAALNASEMRWSDKERRFYGFGGVKLTRGDTVITGDRLESDAELTKVKVTGNAHIIKGGR